MEKLLLRIQKTNNDDFSGVLLTPENSNNTYILNYSNSHCNINLDYSPYIGHACNECDFCYSKCIDIVQSRQYLSNKIFVGNSISKIDSPITIGRYHDIFRNNYMINNILLFLNEVLSTGHKVIIIISNSNIPDAFLDICSKYKDQILIHIKIFSDDSIYGTSLRKLFAPKFNEMNSFDNFIVTSNLNIAIKIDPIILNINSDMIDNIVTHFKSIGVKKFILKTICATNSFKNKISLISRRYASLLSDGDDRYFIYPSDIIFDTLNSVIIKHDDVSFSFCENKILNKILGKDNNCCQIDWLDNE
jgi:hypothetical protein